jgi:precorrin-2/cobalt-factor-2 C20-methyltransferase
VPTTPANFFGLGLGPGDPELLTRKAYRLLHEVDRILLPAGRASGTSFARRIMAPLELPPDRLETVPMCMSRDRDDARAAYQHAADRIAGHTRRGRSVAWVTEGDPLFYSTFIHLHARVRQRHPDQPIHIVPGIPSPMAAAAEAHLPLAQLEEELAIVPASYGLERLDDLLSEFHTVVLLKINRVHDELRARLAERDEPLTLAFVEKVGTDEQRLVHELTPEALQQASYFSLVLLRQESASVPERSQP